MAASPGKTVDVIIGSPRDSFWDTVTVVLKGYYPYQLQKFKTVDEVLELSSDSEFTPVLALIDGQDGTAASNEWVQSIKMSYSNCKIIVLHSSSGTLDFDMVKKNGADEVMHINFDREFISDMILQLAPIDMEGDQIPITALMPVDLRDVEADVIINFDVYAHLPANHRSVLLRKTGDSIHRRHVEKFGSLNQQMYIKKTQIKNFFEYARTIMSMRDLPFPISMTEKFHRSKKAIYQFMTHFLNESSTDYQEGKVILEKCKTIIADFELTKDQSDSDLYAELCRFTGNSRTYYLDCICMSAYPAYFAQFLGWSAEKREAAAIAGLLHNIGLAKLPPSAGDKPIGELSSEELSEYHRYPERSVNMVKAKKVPLSVEIAEAIGQHRENGCGTGFPKKITSENLSEFSKLMIFSYRFHELTALQENKAAMTTPLALDELKQMALSGAGEIDMLLTTGIYKRLKTQKAA